MMKPVAGTATIRSIMRPLQLTSADNPRIKSVIKLRDHATRRQTGLLIAEGEREITRAWQAGLKLREVYDCPPLTRGRQPAWEVMLPDRDRREASQWYELTEPLLRKIAYKDKPEGAIAIFEQPKWTWDDAIAPSGVAGLYLVAVGVAKPGNLGAMARCAAGAGIDALLVADGVVDAFNPNAIRASTGAVFGLPILGGSSSQVRDFLTRQQAAIYAASPHASQTYTQVDMTGPTALVIGAEDTGLDDAWLSAGTPVGIPMSGRWVDSLNASVAAGVLMFEAVRQRRG